jgi:hypothetical protein
MVTAGGRVSCPKNSWFRVVSGVLPAGNEKVTTPPGSMAAPGQNRPAMQVDEPKSFRLQSGFRQPQRLI